MDFQYNLYLWIFKNAVLSIVIGTVVSIYMVIVLNAYANQLSIEKIEEVEKEKRELAATEV